MPIVESAIAPLQIPRVAALATSARPAWLWSVEGARVLWANAVGAAIFGFANTAAIQHSSNVLPALAAAQIGRLAATLPCGGQERFERLRGFGSGWGCAVVCACSRLTMPDGADAVLIVASETAGFALPFGERLCRLVPECGEAVAAFAPDGTLLYANAVGMQRLRGATSLSALGLAAFVAEALRSGQASGTARLNGAEVEIAAIRLGQEETRALLLTLRPREVVANQAKAADPMVPRRSPSAQEPGPEQRQPLRFVWHMDADGRFVVGSDEFIALVGPRTLAACGRLWSEIVAELKLDPDDQIACAVATRETWSNISISWPIDGTTERLPLELSGLPVFDRDRAFAGYRGFGVCRDWGRINHSSRARPTEPLGFTPLARPLPNAGGEGDAAAIDAMPQATEATERTEPIEPAPSEVAVASPALIAANVVPFRTSPASEARPPSLSPVERSAFRELAQELTARLRGTQPEAAVATAGSHVAGLATQLALDAATDEIRDLRATVATRHDVQKAAVSKADFLAKLGDEIRTPLNSIIGFAEVMMTERFDSIGNERYRENLKEMHAAGRYVLSLLDDMLDLCKIETGQLRLTLANVDLNDLTQQCVDTMQPQANRARVIIRAALLPGLPHVVADVRSLHQIVVNLLVNAVKLTGPGGQVIVSSGVAESGEVLLRVRDTGAGLDQTDIEAVLEPFGQTERAGSGSLGLELPLARALAEANHAKFVIMSAPNAGTLVEIAFPSNGAMGPAP